MAGRWQSVQEDTISRDCALTIPTTTQPNPTQPHPPKLKLISSSPTHSTSYYPPTPPPTHPLDQHDLLPLLQDLYRLLLCFDHRRIHPFHHSEGIAQDSQEDSCVCRPQDRLDQDCRLCRFLALSHRRGRCLVSFLSSSISLSRFHSFTFADKSMSMIPALHSSHPSSPSLLPPRSPTPLSSLSLPALPSSRPLT